MERTPSDDGSDGHGRADANADAERESWPTETATTTDRDDESEPAVRLRDRGRETVDALLPEASVDSNWWYWIAAVPAYFLVMLGLGVAAAFLFVFAFALDLAGLAGLGSVVVTLMAMAGFAILGLLGLVVAVMFPVATYVDARAISRAGRAGDWRPDPLLYGLVALVAVLATNVVLSVPFAVYYLYRRHRELGVP